MSAQIPPTLQLPLSFASPALPPLPAHQRHSATSKAAAESVRESAVTLRSRVLAWFASQEDGATDLECIEAFGTQSVRPRRIELWREGLIKDSGRHRLAASNRKAVVWEVVK